MRTARSRSSLVVVGAAGFLAVAAWSLAAAASAQAHDQLVSSAPADGAELTVQPQTVDLVFTEEVVALGVIVEVVDDAGVEWAEEAPSVDGAAVSVPLRDGMASGAYELRWRVVSSDGHPIDGISTFTVALAAPEATTPAAPSEPAASEPTPTQPGESEITTSARPDTVPDDVPLVPTLAVGGALIVLVVVGAVVARRVARRREHRAR